MSDLSDKLAQPESWPTASRRKRHSHPSGWEPGIDTAKGVITAVTDSADGPDWSHVVEALGFDPDHWTVYGDTVQVRSWDVPGHGTMFYHKADLVEKGDSSDVDVDALADRVRRRGPLRNAQHPSPQGGGFLCVVLTDWQCLLPDTMIMDRHTGRIMQLDEHPDAWLTGTREIHTVKVWGGYEITGSADHPIKTRDGWKNLGELTSTDEVAVVDGWTRWGSESLSADVAEFVGLMTSDGTGYREGVQSAKFTNCDPELIEFVDDVARSLGSNTSRYEKGNGWDITFTSDSPGESPVQKLMRDLELDSDDFPTAITGMSKSTQARFLSGLFAGDGCLTTRGSRRQISVELACGNSRRFATTVQMMLHRFGVRSLIRSETMHKASEGAVFHRLVLSSSDVRTFMEEIGPIRGKDLPEGVRLPTSRRYISKESHAGPDGEVLRWARVRCVEAVGESEVWDITVPDKHWFVAQGVQAHNCGKGTAGGAEQLVDRLERLGEQVELRTGRLRDRGVPVDNLALLLGGDLVEGCGGNPHYAMQDFEVELDMRQQTKLVRRMLVELIDRWAPKFDQVVVAAAAGNHGEKRVGGKANTSWSDNYDIEIPEQVAEILAANPDRYSHVKFRLPEVDSLCVTVDLDGLVVAVAHGHQARKGGSTVQQKVLKWWDAMAASRHPVGDADAAVVGHFHHFEVHSNGTHDGRNRTYLQAPALDGGSPWFEQTGGGFTDAGTLTFTACGGRLDHIRIIPADGDR